MVLAIRSTVCVGGVAEGGGNGREPEVPGFLSFFYFTSEPNSNFSKNFLRNWCQRNWIGCL